MSVDFSKLGETKVTIPAIMILAIIIAAFKAENFTIGALDEFFFSEAQGEELAKAVQANTAVLTSYIQRQELRDVNDKIEDAESQIQETQLWMASNGQNPIATDRLSELNSRKRKLEDKKDCLLNDNIKDKSVCDDA